MTSLVALLFSACTPRPPTDTGPGDTDATDSADTTDSSDTTDTADTSDTAEVIDTAALPPDALADRLTSATDLCAYERGDIVDAAPATVPEGVIPDWGPQTQACLDGSLLVHGRVIDGADGHDEIREASASFFHVEDAAPFGFYGEWLDPLDGVDDCGLARFGPDEWYVSAPQLEARDAGTVDVLGHAAPIEMTRHATDNTAYYETRLAAHGDATYGIDVHGSDGSGKLEGFGAIHLPDLVALPESLDVTSPELGPGVEVSRADLPLVWTGVGEHSAEITVRAFDEHYEYDVLCLASDDGAFTIPSALIEALPVTDSARLYVYRRNVSWVGTTWGRTFRASAVSSYSATGLHLP